MVNYILLIMLIIIKILKKYIIYQYINDLIKGPFQS